eukprot:TRINITY_DN7875_c0_g1_i10.p1 TRINITY_DN7875_c0_g1~~TRINITY_DN7875_c0_g1_i10.p1  ORF type:complete len:499 (-),score=57.31 TRINITY_DN7875_c0_g1_i10:464-1960(-)
MLIHHKKHPRRRCTDCCSIKALRLQYAKTNRPLKHCAMYMMPGRMGRCEPHVHLCSYSSLKSAESARTHTSFNRKNYQPRITPKLNVCKVDVCVRQAAWPAHSVKSGSKDTPTMAAVASRRRGGPPAVDNRSTGPSRPLQRFSRGWVSCLLLLPAWLLEGCSDGSSEGGMWVDLQAVAQADTEEFQGKAPRQRRRDHAMKYCSALWTKREAKELKKYAAQWIMWDPANGLAYEYLSKAGHHLGDNTLALRAATSIAEIAPRDAEQLLRAAWLALTLGYPEANTWARRFATRSLEERADNPNTYRALALAAWKDGDYGTAASAYAAGLNTGFHSRYGDVKKVLRQEAATFIRTLGTTKSSLADEFLRGPLKGIDKTYGKDAVFRVTLSWLTDANDVDLHVIGPDGEECFYGNKETGDGLSLYSDQVAGLGPEVIELKENTGGKYKIGVKYFSSGAMGASRGTVVYQRFKDGVQIGEPLIEVFTLPAGIYDVAPVMEVTI